MAINLNEDYLYFEIADLEEYFRAILTPEILEKAMKFALDEVEARVKQNFSDRQADWKPLALSTQYQRQRQHYNPVSPILVRSGTLKNNVAAGREIQITNGEIRGDVFPLDAIPKYGSESIIEYAEALDKIRPFYDLDEAAMDAVYGKFLASISEDLGLV
jgi:hypothetical protein